MLFCLDLQSNISAFISDPPQAGGGSSKRHSVLTDVEVEAVCSASRLPGNHPAAAYCLLPAPEPMADAEIDAAAAGVWSDEDSAPECPTLGSVLQ